MVINLKKTISRSKGFINTSFLYKHKKKVKFILRLVFVAYILFIFENLLLSSQRFLTREMLINNRDAYTNITPFKTILQYFRNFQYFNLTDWLSNILGNVILFIPIGFILPLIASRCKNLFICCLYIFFLPLSIEVIQYTFNLGVFDVDDLILNCFGGLIGYIAYTLLTYKRCY